MRNVPEDYTLPPKKLFHPLRAEPLLVQEGLGRYELQPWMAAHRRGLPGHVLAVLGQSQYARAPRHKKQPLDDDG